MELREANRDDIDQLVVMRELFMLEAHHHIDDDKMQVIKEGTFHYLQKHLNHDCFVFIAVDDDKIVSTVFMIVFEKPAGPHFLTGKIGNIINVYTLPQYRKHGIAGKLVQMAITKAKSNDISYLDLKASQMGESVYRREGFEDDLSEYKNMKLVLK